MLDERREPVRETSPADVAHAEASLLRRLRVIASIVILACIVLTSVVDPLGRLFIDRDFHASEVFLGTLVGALVVLLGLSLPRMPGSRS
jgi:hypothetical protein